MKRPIKDDGMHDIENDTDISLLIDKFYEKVIQDKLLGPIFEEVLTVFREKHIPIMNAFWRSVLFGAESYKGNPMPVHFELDKKHQLSPEHFSRWLALWEETVNENFSGDKAADAILRARNIAGIMEYKIGMNRQ
jgi:hemoglobin